jgi:hypothetical protein
VIAEQKEGRHRQRIGAVPCVTLNSFVKGQTRPNDNLKIDSQQLVIVFNRLPILAKPCEIISQICEAASHLGESSSQKRALNPGSMTLLQPACVKHLTD